LSQSNNPIALSDVFVEVILAMTNFPDAQCLPFPFCFLLIQSHPELPRVPRTCTVPNNQLPKKVVISSKKGKIRRKWYLEIQIVVKNLHHHHPRGGSQSESKEKRKNYK